MGIHRVSILGCAQGRRQTKERGTTHLSTAVRGKVSWIFVATLMLARSMNSSTRELVSISSFCLTSIGSDDSALSIWIFTSGDARLSAPAFIRFALSCRAKELRRRMDLVRSSFCALHRNRMEVGLRVASGGSNTGRRVR